MLHLFSFMASSGGVCQEGCMMIFTKINLAPMFPFTGKMHIFFPPQSIHCTSTAYVIYSLTATQSWPKKPIYLYHQSSMTTRNIPTTMKKVTKEVWLPLTTFTASVRALEQASWKMVAHMPIMVQRVCHLHRALDTSG